MTASSTVAVLTALLLATVACSHRDEAAGKPQEASSAPGPAVKLATVSRRTLTDAVSSPGKTAALLQQKVRAPFAGTLTDLRVADGDEVAKGETIGAIVSRDSEAALAGAREMLREARTAAEKSDASRAVTLAEKSLVQATLTSAVGGRVLAHSASRGDRVSEDQEIVTVEDAASVAFLADVSQGDLARVRRGQTATVALAGDPAPLSGTVRAILPAANAADFTAPVRIDLNREPRRLPLGVFGTARIAVGRRENARVVPDAALVRDDVSGVTRLAVLRQGRAHWIDVVSGLREGGWAEIVSGDLADGDAVILSGQLGLPEGAAATPLP